MTPDAALLFAHLARLRRRAAMVIFIRVLLVAATAMLAATVFVLLRGTYAPSVACATAAAAAMALAAIVTAVRLPSIRSTASAVDRALDLHDRMVTAAQCARSDDAFSQLVVRDALRAVSTVHSSDAFPFRVPRVVAYAPAVAAVAVLAAGVPMIGGFAGLTGGHGSALGGGRLATAAKTSPSPAGDSEPSVRSDIARRDADARAANRRPDSNALTAQPAVGSSEHQNAQSANGGLAGTRSASTGVASSAANATTSFDSRGAGAGSAGQASNQAGGVSGSDPARKPAALRTPTTSERRAYLAAYRAGRGAAEAAIVQDRIPPERRAYVRAYFDAIKPQEQK